MSDIRPIVVKERRLRFETLSEREAFILFDAALAALETRGVSVGSAAALDVLDRAGAAVDRVAGTAKLSAGLVRGALDRAPASFTLAGRVPEHDVTLSCAAPLLAAAAAAPWVLDSGGERRVTATGDVTDACRLADALPEVAAVWAPPAPAAASGDAPDAVAQTAARGSALEACLAGTTRHVILTDLAGMTAATAVAGLAAALAGSAAAVRERPPFSLVQSTPCDGDTAGGYFEAVLACSAAGLPVGFVLPLAGAGAPTDVAAAVTAVTAASLAACVLVQLSTPGAGFIVPALPGVVDGLAPGAGCGPAAARVALGVSQVAAVARLPLAGGPAAAHAATPTWEAAVDNLFTGLTAAMSRTGLVCGAGLLDDGATYSQVQMLLDYETFTNTAAVGAGIVVDDETIAMDVILTAGECGNALGHKHTRRHMREVWRPLLFDRTPHEAWAREGRRDATDRARELAAELLASHEVTPLEAETSATVRRIIEKAGL